ncbi:MAG: hypothetical protein A3J38_09520 [Gammaproteobacteria bacterium RIFCSPHIGHO2_12_FULL_45_9]|nr:MAG: hypothetical protein A3J38_09520 [Gammaproteobacteria bacterium RIFCSPHIGHO2_12_FULL_45_9]
MSHFIGRTEELNLFNGLLKKRSASLVVVYGRRRIGKSRLIEEFGKNMLFLSFSGLFPEKHTTVQDQLQAFHQRLHTFFNLTAQDPFEDWSDAFHTLYTHVKTGRVVILLDEISWMSHNDANFLGKLKNAWDLEFKQNAELILILCGSVSTWIEKNILSNRGFYGRVSLKLCMRELFLPDCSRFLLTQDAHLSYYDQLKIISVMGGIPKYLEEIRPDQSADENIKRICFLSSGLLCNDYHYIFTALLEQDSQYYQKIIECLRTGPQERTELAEKLQITSGSTLSHYLHDLTISGFISRDHTWNLKSGDISKLSEYRLSDNYLRFYLHYIRPNLHKIHNDQFTTHALSALPGWPTVIALQIENIILTNRKLIHAKLGIYPDEIICSGPFFQRKTNRQSGCQIDYLVQTKFGTLYLCEIKFSRQVIRASVIEEVRDKITRLALPRHISIKPVLIYMGDLHDEIVDAHFFAHCIDMTTLLHT